MNLNSKIICNNIALARNFTQAPIAVTLSAINQTKFKMKIIITSFFIIVFLLSLNSCYCQIKGDSLNLLDYDISYPGTRTIEEVETNYFETISKWTTTGEVHNWIRNNFKYDFKRAVLLANNSKSKGQITIYKPEEFWTIKEGICVDLSRFAYETIKVIDSTAHVKYLKIEFEPFEIEGSKFVNHWIIAYRKNNEFYFFADSKRPGKNDGPYATIDDFLKNYQNFRGRIINSYKLLDSYKKVKKSKIYKSKADNRVNGHEP